MRLKTGRDWIGSLPEFEETISRLARLPDAAASNRRSAASQIEYNVIVRFSTVIPIAEVKKAVERAFSQYPFAKVSVEADRKQPREL
jgi:hypothetical protein